MLARAKIRFLDIVPYLFARLDEEGVRDRCVDQWLAAPAAAHHRVSREIMDPSHDSGLRALVDDVALDGSNINPRLQAVIASIQRIPMDDSVAEGPHARAKAIWERARGSGFPWIAATMRQDQNFTDVQELAPALGLDLQEVWDRFSAVVQSVRHATRPKRIQNKLLLRKVYHFDDFGIVGAVNAPAGAPGGPNGGGDEKKFDSPSRISDHRSPGAPVSCAVLFLWSDGEY